MKAQPRERGITLVLSVLFVLIFLGLTVSLSYNARSETQMSNGIKLQQFYSMTARSIIDKERASFDDYWVTADPYTGETERKDWRLGSLLALVSASEQGEFGGLFPTDATTFDVNSGLMTLTYKVWIANNPDDPAFSMKGMDLGDSEVVDPSTWDMDGKVVMTVEVFAPSDQTNAAAVQSTLIGVSGTDYAEWHKNALPEGDFYGVGNLGRGSAGSASRVSLDDSKGDL
ncbi:MAG: hypothetical protein QNK37_01260 [Acidobacteriota bacterium]|nr:hypothetical protein [Acidobacteriota bacterium]